MLCKFSACGTRLNSTLAKSSGSSQQLIPTSTSVISLPCTLTNFQPMNFLKWWLPSVAVPFLLLSCQSTPEVGPILQPAPGKAVHLLDSVQASAQIQTDEKEASSSRSAPLICCCKCTCRLIQWWPTLPSAKITGASWRGRQCPLRQKNEHY